MYTNYLSDDEMIFQGDGLKYLLAVNLPGTELKTVPGIVLSNTCDIDESNSRPFSSNIVYVPLIQMSKYETLIKDKLTDQQRIDNHLIAVKKQHITQIFYLPELKGVFNESIAFLDRTFHLPSNYINRSELKDQRLFTLSDYGIYLFLFKLSLHFTRIQDKVERRSI
jgi:hypothetical protein